MEIKDLEKFIKGNTELSKMKEVSGFSLNHLVKSMILTLKETNSSKYLELKNAYLNEAVKKAEEMNLKGYDKKRLGFVKNMHELEIEILKAKLEIVNKKLEG